jgi:hypothetical protein
MHAHLRFPYAIIVVEVKTSYHIPDRERESPLEWVECDPDFDSLRGDLRFVALIEEMKARFAAG